MIDLTKAIATAVKTGKVSFGANTAIQTAKNGKAKIIVLASNCPKQIKEQIEYYGEISKIPIITYQGDTMDMAAVCNKLFVISALTIRETGDSEILNIVKNDNGDKNTGGN
ncbi:MAG: 50S ribosomal protein L30e [Candidatus Bathyarchaeota archaeon]|nr:50S ribosomal protein L30e [Candidatus Bathyarchaeota archaeon]